MRISHFESPFGPAVVGFVGDALAWLSFGSEAPDASDWPFGPIREDDAPDTSLLEALFKGGSDAEKIPDFALRGTDFQLKVWHALLKIPAGGTISYADLAKSIDRPLAVRAVGSAVGANRIALLIPCHRVVRTDGQLGGYRWGVDLKKRILEAEAGTQKKPAKPASDALGSRP